MIQVSARDVNLLLVAQWRALIREGALFRDKALISFLEINMRMR